MINKTANALKIALLSGAVLWAASAQGALDEKIDSLCGKVKTCAFEQMGDVPPEMKEMMSGMVDGLCKPLIAPYQKTIGDAGLEEKAGACIDSVLKMSCAEMSASQGNAQTEECKEFERAADEAGVDLNKQ